MKRRKERSKNSYIKTVKGKKWLKRKDARKYDKNKKE